MSLNMCKTKIPPEIGSGLEAIQDDNEARKKFGVKGVSEMRKKILASCYVHGLHMRTLNLEQSVVAILNECVLIGDWHLRRELPCGALSGFDFRGESVLNMNCNPCVKSTTVFRVVPSSVSLGPPLRDERKRGSSSSSRWNENAGEGGGGSERGQEHHDSKSNIGSDSEKVPLNRYAEQIITNLHRMTTKSADECPSSREPCSSRASSRRCFVTMLGAKQL